ncbi:MAG: ADP-ribosylglycohydrolase family protein [Armatimonadota bacterium]|nr:ADP-ribosylglycohydrolase family protein [Armatimonadota bacterium]
MRRAVLCALVTIALTPACMAETAVKPLIAKPSPNYRCISVKEYRDKMMAGWIGQIAGVSWGGPTEFSSRGVIMPVDRMSAWTGDMINNAFDQDDLYVEMTFLRSLEQYGLGVSIKQAGLDFANSKYDLWHANKFGRNNLRKGIAPPDSGHPKFNGHADDIDYQIEADFSGLVAPGLPNTAIAMGEKFGRLMNYGDGLYGGQFVGGMYAAAFFENDPVKIVEAGLTCIPVGSQYAEAIRDVLRWYKANPDDWEKTWNLINEKYQKNPNYRKASCKNDKMDQFNIDAKINGAFIVMGLLYGKGDLDQTIIISCRCGQDSDCNPSSAGGVLFTTVGYSNLPARFKTNLKEQKKFSYTSYNFTTLLDVCEKIARQAVVEAGGMVVKDPHGEDFFVIPELAPKTSKLEQCWKPGPITNSVYSPEEMKTIQVGEARK